MTELPSAGWPEPNHPLSYRVRWGWRLFLCFFPLVAPFAIAYELMNPLDGVTLVLTVFFFVPVAVVSGCFASFGRLTITADAVIHRDAFWSRTIRREDLEGYRIERNHGNSNWRAAEYLQLIPRLGAEAPSGTLMHPLQIAMVFATDDAFLRWLAAIPRIERHSVLQMDSVSPDQAQSYLESHPKPVDMARNDD